MDPLYPHDCDNCLFCGTVFDKDYYICHTAADNHTTVLERHSEEPSDYVSYAMTPGSDDECAHTVWMFARYPIMLAVYTEWKLHHKENK